MEEAARSEIEVSLDCDRQKIKKIPVNCSLPYRYLSSLLYRLAPFVFSDIVADLV